MASLVLLTRFAGVSIVLLCLAALSFVTAEGDSRPQLELGLEPVPARMDEEIQPGDLNDNERDPRKLNQFGQSCQSNLSVCPSTGRCCSGSDICFPDQLCGPQCVSGQITCNLYGGMKWCCPTSPYYNNCNLSTKGCLSGTGTTPKGYTP